MKIYDLISVNPQVLGYISDIDKKQETYLPSDHGKKHIMFCVNFVQKFLSEIDADEDTIDSAKSAAFLHDIGCIYGKKDHAINSVKLAKEILDNINIDESKKSIILDAIANHGSGNEINHIVTAVLVLADKCHWSYDRLFETSEMDKVHKFVKSVKKIDANIINDKLIISYYMIDKFDLEGFKYINEIKPVFPKIAKYFNKNLLFNIIDKENKIVMQIN